MADTTYTINAGKAMINYLRAVTTYRVKIFDKLAASLPIVIQQFLDNGLFFHVSLIVTCMYIIILIFCSTKTITLFSLHPVCMTIGTIIFLGEGIVSYRNRFLLESFSPIMQHSQRMKKRAIHQSMQMTGGLFIILGLLFIAANKIEFHHSLVPSTLHSIIGSIAIVLVLLQAMIGREKIDQLQRNNVKIRRWHSDSGLLTWDLLCLTIILGLIQFLSQYILSLSFAILFVIVSWMTVHYQMKKKPSGSDTESGNSSSSNLTTDGNGDWGDHTDETGTLTAVVSDEP